MEIEEFKQRFAQLKARGYIHSLRSKATGVGHTLETELGLSENNLATPDLGKIEVKAHRTHSHNLITLFTFNRGAWLIKPYAAIQRYGSRDRDGRLGLYHTLSLKPNSAGLMLYVAQDKIEVRHVQDGVIAQWDLGQLAQRFQQKIPSLVLVSALVERRDGVEYFYYYRAQWLHGTLPELLADQFRAEHITVDLRMHDTGKSARNHGTAFRVYEDKLPLIFQRTEDL